MKRLVVYAGALMLVGVVSPALAQSGKSLSKCEKALAKETTKLAGGMQKAVSKCLDKAAGEVVADAGSAADAAKVCASSLRKLENSEAPDKTLAAKFLAKVAKVCDPAAIDTKAEHLADEVLDANDPAGLQAGLLGSYCGEFDGDGSLDDVGEWLDCAVQAAACSALQQVAIEYPRAPEWLGVIATAIAALDPNDPKNIDAATTASAIVGRLDGDADGEVDLVCGTNLAAVKCGNGVVDPGEDCDQGDLNGSTCVDEGFAGGTLVCGADCVYDTSVCWSARFEDNGDGTITDNETGLEWEKKVKLDSSADYANLQDADNFYRWSGTCSVNPSKHCQPNTAASTACFAGVEGDTTGCDECTGGDGVCNVGSPGITVWQWLNDLNTASFGGNSDWRLARRGELESILDIDFSVWTPPVVDVAFHSASCGPACTDVTDPACSCTRSSIYWSASSCASTLGNAWRIGFNDGGVEKVNKAFEGSVRAVRAGS